MNLYFEENGETDNTSQLLHTARMEYVPESDTDRRGNDIFSFQLTDGDGDVASNTIVFTASPVEPDSAVTSIDQLTFREEHLHKGSSPDYLPLVQNGRLEYDLSAGLAGLQIAHNGARYNVPKDGYENIITDQGIFSIWQEESAIGYSFILSDPLFQTGEADTLEFEAILTGGNGNVYAGNDIFIHIVNDSPRTIDTKTWNVSSDNPDISGNASDYYLAGADGGVFSWLMGDTSRAEIEKYGDLTLENTGAYSFSLNPEAEAPAKPLTLVYGFEDADGDSITGNIFIDIA